MTRTVPAKGTGTLATAARAWPLRGWGSWHGNRHGDTTMSEAIDIEDECEAPSVCLDGGEARFYKLDAEFNPETRSVVFHEDHPSVNTVSAAVWHNRVICFRAPDGVDAEQVAEVLKWPGCYERLQRLADEYECVWDGNNNVGKYGDAWPGVQDIYDEVPQLEPRWSAVTFREWCYPAKDNILAELRGDAALIPAKAEEIVGDAMEDSLLVVGDGEAVLREWLEESLEQDDLPTSPPSPPELAPPRRPGARAVGDPCHDPHDRLAR